MAAAMLASRKSRRAMADVMGRPPPARWDSPEGRIIQPTPLVYRCAKFDQPIDLGLAVVVVGRGADEDGERSRFRIQAGAGGIGSADGDAGLIGGGYDRLGFMPLDGETDDGRRVAPQVAKGDAGQRFQSGAQAGGEQMAARLDLDKPDAERVVDSHAQPEMGGVIVLPGLEPPCAVAQFVAVARDPGCREMID